MKTPCFIIAVAALLLGGQDACVADSQRMFVQDTNGTNSTDIPRGDGPDFRRFDDYGCRTSRGGKGSEASGDFDLMKHVSRQACERYCLNKGQQCFGYEYLSHRNRCKVWEVPIGESKLEYVPGGECHIKTGGVTPEQTRYPTESPTYYPSNYETDDRSSFDAPSPSVADTLAEDGLWYSTKMFKAGEHEGSTTDNNDAGAGATLAAYDDDALLEAYYGPDRPGKLEVDTIDPLYESARSVEQHLANGSWHEHNVPKVESIKSHVEEMLEEGIKLSAVLRQQEADLSSMHNEKTQYQWEVLDLEMQVKEMERLLSMKITIETPLGQDSDVGVEF